MVDPSDLLRLQPEQLRELVLQRLASSQGRPSAEQWRYGELTAQQRVSLASHFPSQPRRAAVLIPLLDRAEGLTVLLTERSAALRQHAGQISFPGGRIEAGDSGAEHAALRESEEEIGLPAAAVRVLGRLPDQMIVSGFRVTPVVGLIAAQFQPRPDPREVAATFELPLSFLLDSHNHVRRTRTFADQQIELTDLPFGQHNIWGATAAMLLTLYRLLRGDEP